jgi:hypothetical protein
MNPHLPVVSNTLRARVAYLLHWGCVEIRSLAFAGAPHQQIADLADALELLPRYVLEEPSPDDWEMVRFVITNYNNHYPDSGWRLVQRLDIDPPERY